MQHLCMRVIIVFRTLEGSICARLFYFVHMIKKICIGVKTMTCAAFWGHVGIINITGYCIVAT